MNANRERKAVAGAGKHEPVDASAAKHEAVVIRILLGACGNTRSLSCGPVPVLLSLACLAVNIRVRFLALVIYPSRTNLGPFLVDIGKKW